MLTIHCLRGIQLGFSWVEVGRVVEKVEILIREYHVTNHAIT
jgi:hypothetical protein